MQAQLDLPFVDRCRALQHVSGLNAIAGTRHEAQRAIQSVAIKALDRLPLPDVGFAVDENFIVGRQVPRARSDAWGVEGQVDEEGVAQAGANILDRKSVV